MALTVYLFLLVKLNSGAARVVGAYHVGIIRHKLGDRHREAGR